MSIVALRWVARAEETGVEVSNRTGAVGGSGVVRGSKALSGSKALRGSKPLRGSGTIRAVGGRTTPAHSRTPEAKARGRPRGSNRELHKISGG